MAYVPYVVRHVHRTVEDLLLDALTGLGWLGPEVPFGASVVRFQRGRMDESELRAVTGNLVAVSFGDEPDDEPQELGGGLTLVTYVVFVDVVGENEAIALAIASDLKDRLAGRMPGTSRFSPVFSYRVNPRTPVDGHKLEFTDVVRTKPDNVDYRRNWQAVKSTVEMTYVGEE